jgi:hypothetical protein
MLTPLGGASWGKAMREPGYIKRPARIETHFPATLVDADGSRIPVTVTDISRQGCKLESEAPLKIGAKVQLELPKHGVFPAQIRWALGNSAGAIFLEQVFLA